MKLSKETLELLDQASELTKKLIDTNLQLDESLIKDTNCVFGLCTFVNQPQLYHHSGVVDYDEAVNMLKTMSDEDLKVRWDGETTSSFALKVHDNNCIIIVNKDGGHEDEDNM